MKSKVLRLVLKNGEFEFVFSVNLVSVGYNALFNSHCDSDACWSRPPSRRLIQPDISTNPFVYIFLDLAHIS